MAILFKEGSIDPRPESTDTDRPTPSQRVPADEIEIPPATATETLKLRQIALRAFVGMFILVVASATVYLASRRSDVQNAAAKAANEKKAIAPVQQSQPVQPTPADPAPSVAGTVPSISSSAEVAAKPQTSSPPTAQPTAKLLDQPLPNRMYLQVGSLEKGVAEVLAQGLRIKGVPATVAPGVSPIVSRIIVGPFATSDEMGVVNKHLSELGFKPFPRRFEPQELRRLLDETAATPTIPTPQQPDVRR
jgi:cell division septation protein DedD